MINPFLCSSKQLSQYWRMTRDQLTSDKLDLEHLEIVTRFWSYAPISASFLDWDHPNTWPDPWELIAEMTFDASAVALGMEYTLLLAEDQRWTTDRLTLSLSTTIDRSQQLLTLIVDDAYVLNYEYGAILPITKASNELAIQQSYQYINKMHEIK